MEKHKNIFTHTDLAYEGCAGTNKLDIGGIKEKERLKCGIQISDVTISEDSSAKLIGRPIGCPDFIQPWCCRLLTFWEYIFRHPP